MSFGRIGINRLVTRNFSSTRRVLSGFHPEEGVYTNIPFKVKRKYIPLSVYYWGTLGFFFFFPFISTYWHLRKAGSFDM
ncbi:cytochrome c oxidase subunit 8, mitochondrial [[Candida] jaroonii]|uniref:Cytochrome c oxidase subunit 8, mitochondrial n=1 Tax=[Candida] jaroonii TaxID=467808 RepID=A0ACA9Y0R5_9ASCO|nr:cytochrome c oxidase subunit 8, mitochondrial [[Candida] jaroonii]